MNRYLKMMAFVAMIFVALFLGCADNSSGGDDGEFFVSNAGNGSITSYSLNDDGDIAPLQTIAGGNTGLRSNEGMFIDNGEIFIANFLNSITVYQVTDDGDVVPQRTIAGANTQLSAPVDVCVAGGEIFVAQLGGNNILVFLQNDDGDVAPQRVIAGLNTGLTGPNALFVTDGEIFVANGEGGVTVYLQNDDGDVAPQRTIAGLNTGLQSLSGIFVTGGEIFVVNDFPATSISVFNVNDNGDVAPQRVIAGGNTTLEQPTRPFVTGGEIFVPDSTTESVMVFLRNDNGDVAPQRTITGANTGITNGRAVFINDGLITSKKAKKVRTTKSKLSHMQLIPQVRGIEIKWQNQRQDIAGFYLYRAKKGEEYELVTPLLFPLQSNGEYSFLDIEAFPEEESYYYKLQTVEVGKKTWDRALFIRSQNSQKSLEIGR